MVFSKTCEYAIRAVIYIAQKSEDGTKVGIKEISAGIDSPVHFIAKILQDLSKREIVQSSKGPNGGFYIDKDSRKKTLADVVTAIDGDKLFIGCGLGLKNCSESKPCPLHSEFKSIREKIKVTLHNATIGDFNESLNAGLSFIKER
ncbi:transcriptional regulator, BadM/Rrf2 family [Dyadobacter koreensis]|uniref:Transcriptional regulator, BadM/Rrf2 family n=1 Tax=Dyadobacter koreensis TaxID=408657 RepID=A0A1H6ZH66_9BACT|nr:Rrf2 family transcriptional regulator [Dyadobacter koreensis]SEJ48185.1 transcriptional regulator, BadM/Rrf2 family [Dyadobacter koreensis]